MRRATFTTLAAILALATAASAGAGAATKPTVRLVDLSPVKVRGAHFVPREQVRVTWRAGGAKRVRTTHTSAAGGFTVDFGMLREKDRCGVVMPAHGGRRAAATAPRAKLAAAGVHDSGARARTRLRTSEGPPGTAPRWYAFECDATAGDRERLHHLGRARRDVRRHAGDRLVRARLLAEASYVIVADPPAAGGSVLIANSWPLAGADGDVRTARAVAVLRTPVHARSPDRPSRRSRDPGAVAPGRSGSGRTSR